MRPLTTLLAALILYGACAAPPPAPTPEPRPAEPEAQAPSDRPAESSPLAAGPPDLWWLLDSELDDVPGTSVLRARAEILSEREPRRTVVVAIIDSGVDIRHDDLRASLWVNDGEAPGTGRDDDGNGYVDDVHGWNFIGGPDGRNVERDTYEVARLKAACRSNGARGPPPHVGSCEEIRAAFEAKIEETADLLDQVRNIDQAVVHFERLLRAHLEVDSLTPELVAEIRSPRRDIRQARDVYLQLAAEGITAAMITEELERLGGRMEYGLNPDFDPRDIVGDDYADLSERSYGNADVTGPDASHGTHVAGIVAAGGSGGTEPMGIAPSVRVMSIRAVPDGDERDKDVANAIRYAVDNGAHIINMSFGKPFSPGKTAVDEAVRYADSRGVLMVHAAGNDGADLDVEPSFPSRVYMEGDTARLWIEVGASGWRSADRLAAPFSNYGRNSVDVFAPGVTIRSTVPGNGYRVNSGTSMAAPVVSGIAALLMAYFPELDAGDVRRIILDSATAYGDRMVIRPGTEEERVPFGTLSRTGAVVNAYAALRMAEDLVGAR